MDTEKKKVAVICCYNREDILASMLEAGLENQVGVDIERLFFYNKFKSAAETFNYAIRKTSAEYLVFVHQDIEFKQKDFLLKVTEEIDNKRDALYGLCGTSLVDERGFVYSNVFHGLWNKTVGESIEEKKEVCGLDEIFLACHRMVFERIQFDAKLFDGWHMYVEDICLQAQLAGMKVYVLPLVAQHKNFMEMPKYMTMHGILPEDYFAYVKRIRKKYKGKFDKIASPCIVIELGFFKFYKYFWHLRLYYKFKYICRKISLR